DLAVPDDHGADLRNGLPLHLETGGLDVEGHVFICKGKVLVTMDGDAVVQVVDEVALHAVEELDVPGGVPGVGKAWTTPWSVMAVAVWPQAWARLTMFPSGPALGFRGERASMLEKEVWRWSSTRFTRAVSIRISWG